MSDRRFISAVPRLACLAAASVLGMTIALVHAGVTVQAATQRTPSATLASADTRTIRVIGGKGPFTVPAFLHEQVLYGSLTHLSSGLALRTVTDETRGKLELIVGTRRLKLTAANPFVVVLDHAANTIERVHQLPVEVIRSTKTWYIPVAEFVPILTSVWPSPVRWDDARTTLTLVPDSLAARFDASQPDGSVARLETRARPATTVSPPPIAPSPPPSSVSARDAGSSRTSAGTAASAARYDISHVSVDARKNGTLLRIHGTGAIPAFRRTEDGARLVIEIDQAVADVEQIRQTPLVGPDVRSITAEQRGSATRIDIEVDPAVTSRQVTRPGGRNELLVSLFREVSVETVLSEEEQEKKRRQSGGRARWALDCIVIDPGHGGKDPGAIGVTGIREKNVTLGIALKLGALIEREMKGVKVVYTRKDDTFIELYRRGQIANAAGGKLFVSIHCNSTEEKPSSANGFEVYLLRPGRTEEAIRIAEFENSVVKLEKDYEKRYEKLTAENFIIVSMAQSAYMKHSERFAELLHEQAKKSPHLGSKGVKQAGFYVLVGASMPSVLIEAGFLSNKKEEAFLATRAGQEHLATMIFNAIEKYAVEYQKSLDE